ncbi:hypothetical protein KI387_014442, partial [Taxus chinensis]
RTKLRMERESTGFLKDSPFRAVRRYSSRTAGKKVREVREGCKKVKKLQTRTRKPESAEAGDFHLGQLGQ